MRFSGLTHTAFVCLAALLCLPLGAMPAHAQAPHPLDPLSAGEIAATVSAIAASGKANRATRAAIITLNEPDKAMVIAWRNGDGIERHAYAVLRIDGETIEAVVNLATGEIESWKPVPGAQSAILSVEWAAAQKLVKADPRWQAAMKLRGYEEFDDIFCESLSAGYFATEEEEGKRLLKMPCYDISGAQNNIYARPIEGLIATVDLDAMKVLDILDEGVVPVGTATHDFDEQSIATLRTPMRAIRNVAPDGWNFEMDGRMVSWQGWSFHLGFDQRFGPVLSLVNYADGGRQRSVLYQAHVSEVFVPYMDPIQSWSFKTYLDAGEFGLGTLASPLTGGTDCPEAAVFIDATLSTPSGGSYQRERVLCVFERDTAAPLWRHWEALNGAYEGRPATELVIRSIASVAHYDYVIDWVFTQNGEIQVNLGATGIDAVKAVAANSMTAPNATSETAHGTLVAPGHAAVFHDHYFSIRLDFDIDGPVNSFRRERLASVVLPEDSLRRSLWQLEAVPMLLEGGFSAHGAPEVWRIENPNLSTELGHHPGYQIVGQGPTSLLAADDWPQRRATFSAHNLWITARRPGELYAAGAFPNQSKGGDGLPAYTDGESILEADLVAWYSLGFHHVTRPEDWPILSTVWQGVKLRPFGFFTQNPALGVRRQFLDAGQ